MTILNELVAHAKAQGINQAELAERAGVHPTSLSRALKSGQCQLSTVVAVAKVLQMRLVAVPDNSLAEGLAKGNLF